MIVARGNYEEDELLVLGLTAQNVQRLVRGAPILVRREVHGDGIPDGWKIMLVFGQTEEAIKHDFKKNGLIKEDTSIMIEKNLGKADDR